MLPFSKSGRWPSEYEIELWARAQRRRLLKACLRRASGRIADLARTASDWLAARKRQLDIRRRLLAMDDRLLADIGLTRGEIEFAWGGRRAPDPRRPSAIARAGRRYGD